MQPLYFLGQSLTTQHFNFPVAGSTFHAIHVLKSEKPATQWSPLLSQVLPRTQTVYIGLAKKFIQVLP